MGARAYITQMQMLGRAPSHLNRLRRAISKRRTRETWLYLPRETSPVVLLSSVELPIDGLVGRYRRDVTVQMLREDLSA